MMMKILAVVLMPAITVALQLHTEQIPRRSAVSLIAGAVTSPLINPSITNAVEDQITSVTFNSNKKKEFPVSSSTLRQSSINTIFAHNHVIYTSIS